MKYLCLVKTKITIREKWHRCGCECQRGWGERISPLLSKKEKH